MKDARRKKYLKWAAKLVVAVFVVWAIIWVNQFAANDDLVVRLTQQYGYAGILLVAAISGFNVFFPIPVIGFYPFFMQAGLDPFFVITTVTVGMTLGDSLGFLIGNQGRTFVKSRKKNKILKQIERLQKKSGFWPLVVLFFYAGFAPIPNELIVIPMAFLGFKYRYMIIALLLGNAVFNTLVALGLMKIFA